MNMWDRVVLLTASHFKSDSFHFPYTPSNLDDEKGLIEERHNF